MLGITVPDGSPLFLEGQSRGLIDMSYIATRIPIEFLKSCQFSTYQIG